MHTKQFTINYRPSKKRKTVALVVKSVSDIRLYYPEGTTQSLLDNFLERKKVWLRKSVYNMRHYRANQIPSRSGQSISLRGTNKILEIKPAQDIDQVREYLGKVVCYSTSMDQEYVGKLMQEWLKETAEQEVGQLYYQVCRDLGIKRPPSVVFKYMKRQWGNYCPNHHRITLNISLMGVPEECARYVIAHEIAHIKYQNHSRQYYQHLQNLYPNWATDRKLLRQHSVYELL